MYNIYYTLQLNLNVSLSFSVKRQLHVDKIKNIHSKMYGFNKILRLRNIMHPECVLLTCWCIEAMLLLNMNKI